MAFANFYNCPDLNAEAEDFLHLHFTEVYKLDTFLKLVVTDITRILQEDKLVVQSEDQVLSFLLFTYMLLKGMLCA